MRALTAAVVIFAFCALAATVRVTADEERVSKVVPLQPGGSLRLNNFSGRVTITPSDRPEVAIEALRHGTAAQLERVKLDIRTEGSAVVVDADRHDNSWFNWAGHNNVVDTDLNIKVPKRTNLDIHVFSSPVDVTGIQGSHEVHTFSSKVRLEDVAGSVRAHTFSGSVEIREKSWADNEDIDVDTFSGSIDLYLPESARGTVNFRSFSGRLTSDVPLALDSTSRRNVTAKLGDGEGGSLRLKTFSGNVRIGR